MENQTSINTLVGITWLVMCGVFAGIVFLYMNHKKTIRAKEREKEMMAFRAAAEAEERQKERIANNLHDEVIPLLAVLIQNSDSNIRDFNNKTFDPLNFTNDKQIAYQLIDSVKAISLELIPKVLLELGLVSALGAYLKRINGENIQVEFENRIDSSKLWSFKKSEEVAIYRICLEVLNNLQKHDQFTFLKVMAFTDEKNLVFSFDHNGTGITNREIEVLTESSHGLGLKSLQSRMLILRGTIDYTKMDKSAKIIVNVPLNQ